MRNNITLHQMETLWSELDALDTIGEWKERVILFRDEHDLNDLEAINIANKVFKSNK